MRKKNLLSKLEENGRNNQNRLKEYITFTILCLGRFPALLTQYRAFRRRSSLDKYDFLNSCLSRWDSFSEQYDRTAVFSPLRCWSAVAVAAVPVMWCCDAIYYSSRIAYLVDRHSLETSHRSRIVRKHLFL